MTQTPIIPLPMHYVAHARQARDLLEALDALLLVGDHPCVGEERRLYNAALSLSTLAVRDAGKLVGELEALAAEDGPAGLLA